MARYRLEWRPNLGGLELLRPQNLAEVETWPTPTELPPDWVLRELFELQSSTPDEIVKLAAEWGLPTPTDARPFAYFAGVPPQDLLDDLTAWAAAGHDGLVHPGAVDLHLRTLRTLARHLLAHIEDRGEHAIVDAWEVEGPGEVLPTGSAQAWLWWESYMNRGLSPFAVHVSTLPNSDALLSRPLPTLFTAGCLQLVHYLTDGVAVQRCANARCGRPFTRQRGDAKYGHRSRGVRYCSPLCAKAQAERERRRRRAAERVT